MDGQSSILDEELPCVSRECSPRLIPAFDDDAATTSSVDPSSIPANPDPSSSSIPDSSIPPASGYSDAEHDDHDCAICHGEIEKILEPKPKKKRKAKPKKTATILVFPWISCDACQNWFHQQCVSVEESEAHIIDKYHCPKCVPTAGLSIDKKILVPHRFAYDDLREMHKPPQIGSKGWIAVFKETEASIPACPTKLVPVHSDGYEFMNSFKWDADWKNPVKILNVDGLGMRMPGKDFDIDKLYELVGGDEVIDTIDVYMQLSGAMSFKRFYEYWKVPEPRERLFNMLSFEFSHTKLIELVTAPELMYKLSWVHNLWPSNDGKSTEMFKDMLVSDHIDLKPEVAMFCLLGMGGSFTDFHIDFGGSSVWYHVHHGQKVFYIVEPTDKNLRAFAKWTNNPDRSEIFFGDMLEKNQLWRVVINPGETVMIPGGWIHAVYTPVDSMVFGGNYIHSLNIKEQLQVYQIEKYCNYDDHLLFPSFELINWYAGLMLQKQLKDANEKRKSIPKYLVKSCRALKANLKKFAKQLNRERMTINPMFGGVISGIEYELNRHSERTKQKDRKVESQTEANGESANTCDLSVSMDKSAVVDDGFLLSNSETSFPFDISTSPMDTHGADGASKSEVLSSAGDRSLSDCTESMKIEIPESHGSPTSSTSPGPGSLKLKFSLSKSSESPSPSPKDFKHHSTKPEKPAEKVKLAKKDNKLVSNIFTCRRESGRKIKPASWVQQSGISITPDECDEERKRRCREVAIERQRQEELIDRIAIKEAEMGGDGDYSSDEDFVLGASKKRKHQTKLSFSDLSSKKLKQEKPAKAEKKPPKPKKMETVKQRLAKKMKLGRL